jgi:VanZ family protein
MHWLWVWGPAVAQMAAIFALSSMSGVPDLPGGLSNYTGHFIGYGLLGTLLLRGFAGARWAAVSPSSGWRAVVLASAYGVTDEVHQAFVPGRTSSVEDWAADTIGAVTGIVLVLLVARVRRLRDRANV